MPDQEIEKVIIVLEKIMEVALEIILLLIIWYKAMEYLNVEYLKGPAYADIRDENCRWRWTPVLPLSSYCVWSMLMSLSDQDCLHQAPIQLITIQLYLASFSYTLT